MVIFVNFQHHSQDFPTAIDATYSLLKPVHPPLDSKGKIQDLSYTYMYAAVLLQFLIAHYL